MCRVSGVWAPSWPKEARLEAIQRINTQQARGGPDADGAIDFDMVGLTLGHRRLSLLDLSTAGDQPMSYGNQRYWLSYNGEVYNFQELRSTLQQQGCSFVSQTDSEVILAAFATWGEAAFVRLSGMFAFALWDSLENLLYLVRDQMGIKPLYWGKWADGIAFASSVKGFNHLPPFREAAPTWPLVFLAFGHLPEPITTKRDVLPLAPGCFIKCNLVTGKLHESSFVSAPEIVSKIRDATDARKQLREALTASVKRQLVCDAPIGVFLSGGIDSSIIAGLAHEQAVNLHTTSIYFSEADFSERKHQQLVSQQLPGSKHHEFLISEDLFFEQFPNILTDIDQPTCDGINTWFISRKARKAGLKAVLSGIGADELFGGYPSFQRMRTLNQLMQLPTWAFQQAQRLGKRKYRRLAYLQIPGAVGRYLCLRGLFTPREIAQHLDAYETEVWEVLANLPSNGPIAGESPFEQASWLEVNWYLKNQLLRDSDAMSMAHGLEIRVPYLDDAFVALAKQISPALKADGPYAKQLLIESHLDLLPESIWKRPKSGFTFPFASWLAQPDQLRPYLTERTRGMQTELQQKKIHWSQLYALLLLDHV